MDDAKRRALIRSKAAKKTADDTPPATGPSNPSAKRKTQPKADRQAKKAKVSLDPVVGLMAEPPKTVTPTKHGVGKGLMKGPSKVDEKPPVLLREDSKHALEQISSIISAEDYEDLGNHSTEAMGETGLFAITQAMVMMKGLMGRCLSQETALDRVRAKAEKTEEELLQLRNWRPKIEKKLELSEKARKSLEQTTEEAKKALESKDKEIAELKNEVRQAKDAAVREYRDSDALITELGDSFHQGFMDALRQVRQAYPDVDPSKFKVEDPVQSSVVPVASEDTDDLFDVDDAVVDGAPAPAKDDQAEADTETVPQPVDNADKAQ
ncbi:uncharacterized protein LOC126720992 [Quercus robur]|uniref:uncharacterized protein LOC126698392 n=1 Tax=Quercus robur TaxID=38942 RepID=UPI002162842A|nr:uncharacterized protein LOC126698392 [Quercus robur]XP_050260683.1 uncharacterized protein LOC126705623 [Quercus robur]XP_050279895.1 uncharacterized protein LOC126720992 [Quercus robur]